MPRLSRRDCLKVAAGAAISQSAASFFEPQAAHAAAKAKVEPKSLAAVVTIYTPGSHSDVILGKILEGWEQQGGPGPALTLASMYVDQFPSRDLAREMSRKHNVPIFDSIEEAVTVGGNGIPVDGVLSIGEHGDYPWNDIGQHLYPRRRFFSEICDTFEKQGRVVPVFSDKHLGPVWDDGKWMYDRARELEVPFMAGSSLPVGYRDPEFSLPMPSPIESAVGIGYAGLDVYGIHALEFFQYHVERRPNAEHGVKAVQALQGPAIWRAVDDGAVDQEVLDAAFATVPKIGDPDMREDDEAALFLFDYTDGFRGALFMMRCVRGTAFSARLKGESTPISTAFDERHEPRYPHFAYLLKAIEAMMHTGQPTYPVERTLLTGGILDRALTSRSQGGRRLDTPELHIAYEPVDYPYAPHVDLLAPPPVAASRRS